MSRSTALLALLLLSASDLAHADLLQPRATDFAAKYKPFTLVLGPTRKLLYCGYTGTLHELENRNGKLVEVATRDLWSPVIKLLAADLDGDGQDEIVGYTRNDRLFVLKGTDLSDIWNTVDGRLNNITAITIGDVDQDGQPEIVLIVDKLLRVFSAMKDVEEFKGTTPFLATDIALGDVTGDGRLDLVLNTGEVIDSYYHNLEWTNQSGFGVQIDLFDIDGDGKLEVIGLSADGLVRVWDVDERRLKFN